MMNDERRRLHIDVGFLDRKQSPSTSRNSDQVVSPPVQTGYKYNGKNILFFVLLVIVGGWFAFVDKDNSSLDRGRASNGETSVGNTSAPPKTTQTSNTQPSAQRSYDVTVGDFRCSNYHANQADHLRPSNFVEAQIESEKASLTAKGHSLDSLRNKINLTYVDQSDQTSIDSYNGLINRYNASLDQYKREQASYNNKVDAFNVQVDRYNRYLATNCMRQ